MRNIVMATLLAASSVSTIACAAPSASEETQANDITSRGARDAAPLSGDELRFEKFLHVDTSTGGWPSHSYADFSGRVRVATGTVALDASLYLERDRTFTLYYSELAMVDAYNGRPRTQRKLTGTWRANGATLELGSGSATTVMTQDAFGHAVEGLAVSLPEGWAGEDVAGALPLVQGGSNVGPNAPFWSDYR